MDATETQEAARLRDLLQLLVRVQKALRLYQGRNPVTDQLEGELHCRLTELLQDHARLDLTVRQFQILYDGTPVYEQRNRTDSLAFLFFRDGIRALSFLQGLEPEELHAFLGCLNRVGLVAGGQDDLVTLFWEQDFQSIRYLAVEELAHEGHSLELEERLASGALPGTELGVERDEDGTGSSPDWAGSDELEQPVARLPTESAQLSEEEADALRREIAAQEGIDLASTLSELAAEIALLEPSDEERAGIAKALVEILDQRLEEGDLDTVLLAYRRLLELAASQKLGGHVIDQLEQELTTALAEPARLERLIAGLEGMGEPGNSAHHLLARVARPALATLIGWLPRIENPRLRHAVADAVAGVGPQCAPELARQLSTLLGAAGSTLPVVLHVLGRLPPESSLPILHRLLRSPAPAVRREAVQALGQYRGKQVERLWLELLGDNDPQVRARALAALRTGRPKLWSKILNRLSETGFLERDLAEKRRTFATVARLGGADALPWFGELLQPPKKRWFLPRQEQEMMQAAVHAVRTVGTPEAEELLRRLARTGDRCARAACQAELGGSPPAGEQ